MIKSLYNLYSFLRLTKDEIDFLVNKIDDLYYEKTKNKKKFGEIQVDKNGNPKKRHLIPPVKSLRTLQEKINSQFKKIILPDYMYGSVDSRNNIQNALRHIDNNYFLTIDLKNFFSNITHHQVFRAYTRNGFSPSVARILTQLTTFKKSLPQGAPTSPALANLTFLPTGNKLSELARKHDIVFTTYLDDISFSSKKCFKNLVPEILKMIKADGFLPHNQKIHYRESNSEITGLFIRHKRLHVIELMQEKAKTNKDIMAYVNQVHLANKWLSTFDKTNLDRQKTLPTL